MARCVLLFEKCVERVAGLCIVFCRISQRQPQNRQQLYYQGLTSYKYFLDVSGRLSPMACLEFSGKSTTGIVHRC